MACADGRFPVGQRYAGRLPVVVSVIGRDGRIRRTFGCHFDGDPRQLYSMAAENRLNFINLQPGTVSLAMSDADCVEPRPGLPAGVFDLQMRGLRPGKSSTPAGCLLHGSLRPELASRTGDLPPDGALLLRFQRVSFPALDCKYRGLKDPDVVLKGLAGVLDDHFYCRFRYHTTTRGPAVAAMLRYLSGAYSLRLDASTAGLPLLTLPPYQCGAVGDEHSDADFVVSGPSGRSVGCNLSKHTAVAT